MRGEHIACVGLSVCRFVTCVTVVKWQVRVYRPKEYVGRSHNQSRRPNRKSCDPPQLRCNSVRPLLSMAVRMRSIPALYTTPPRMYICTNVLCERELVARIPVDDGGLCEGEVVHMRHGTVNGGGVGKQRGGWLRLFLPHAFAAEEATVARRAHQSHWLRSDGIQGAVAREGVGCLPQRQRSDLMQHGQEGNWAHEYVIVDEYEPLEAVSQVGVEESHGFLAATHRPEAEILSCTIASV